MVQMQVGVQKTNHLQFVGGNVVSKGPALRLTTNAGIDKYGFTRIVTQHEGVYAKRIHHEMFKKHEAYSAFWMQRTM